MSTDTSLSTTVHHARPFFVWTDISLSELPDTAVGCSDSIQIKRLQVLNTWREIRLLEEELEEKLVSTSTTTATERRIKDLKVPQDKLSLTLRL